MRLDVASLDDDELLEQFSDIAFEKLDAAEKDLAAVEEPFRTVAIVYSAQGVIDNGGLVYFFESNWPETPPYSVFADAYERIGRKEAADSIRNAAASFGFAEPEKDAERRRAFMEKHFDARGHEVTRWDDCICGDSEVWSDLAAWVRENYSS